MKLRLDVSTQSEFYDGCVDFIEVELTSDCINEINRLSKLVAENSLYKVAKFNEFPITYYIDSWDEETGDPTVEEFEGRLDCVTFNVTNDDFFWQGYYKHTQVHWESSSVDLAVINEEHERNVVLLDLRDHQ